MPKVYSLHPEPGQTAPKDAVLIDRRTKWGNPFKLSGAISREQSVTMYRQWLLNRPDLIEAARLELKGKDLVCWCAPLLCHGDVLLQVANEGVS